MKIEVMKFNGENDYLVRVDGEAFTPTTTMNGMMGHKAMAAYIIRRKYNALLQGGSLMGNYVDILFRGQSYTIKIGENAHKPDNGRHFMNVLSAHMKNLNKKMQDIVKEPLYTFEV